MKRSKATGGIPSRGLGYFLGVHTFGNSCIVVSTFCMFHILSSVHCDMLSCCCQCFCSMQNLFVVATHYVWQTNLFQAINLLHFTRISTSHGVFTRLHECIKMAHLKGNNELLRRLDTLPSGTCIFTNVAVSNQLE